MEGLKRNMTSRVLKNPAGTPSGSKIDASSFPLFHQPIKQRIRMVCQKCFQSGHNSRTCTYKEKTVAPIQPPQPPQPPQEMSAPVQPLQPPQPQPQPPQPPQEMSAPRSTLPKWSEESKNEFLETVKCHPITIDWKEMSTRYHRTEATLKAYYYEKVSPTEHTQYCMSQFNSENMLDKILEIRGYECVRCQIVQYSVPKRWKEESFCEECHQEMYKEEIEERWRQVSEMARESGKDRCVICEREAVYNKEIGARFHFDHINMFDKSGSISTMVQSGTERSDIQREISKCQIMCISCHAVVTEIERRCGFMRIKNHMTRDQKKNGAMDSEEEKREEEKRREEYERCMRPVYDELRERWRRSRRPAGRHAAGSPTDLL